MASKLCIAHNLASQYEPYLNTSFNLYIILYCAMYKLNEVPCYSMLCSSMEIKLQSKVKYCATIGQYNKA